MDKKQLVTEIKEYLNINLDGIVTDVILFGSQVKGTESSDSDYDVLVILKTDDTFEIRSVINDLCYDIDLMYNIFLDTQIISETDLKYGIKGKHPLFQTAIMEGVYG
jgi:predicted nucleotidyltransferase